MAISWTPEELAELAAFDSEIDAEDDLTDEEILLAEARDRKATGEKKARCSGAGSYYERNREYCKARQRAYSRANRDIINAKHRARYQADMDKYRAYQRNLIARNREQYSEIQKVIMEYRLSLNMSKKEFGAILGRSDCTIDNWEKGHNAANWELIARKFPDFPIPEKKSPKEVCETSPGQTDC